MKYLRYFEGVLNYPHKSLCSNIEEYNVGQKVTPEIISQFKTQFPNKWILSHENTIFVKDKPERYDDEIPQYVYHVSNSKLPLKEGLKPGTELDSPFGYYNLIFFYLNEEDAKWGSIPHIEDETYLYKVDTRATNNWLEPINMPMDGEDGITTSDFISPEFIELV